MRLTVIDSMRYRLEGEALADWAAAHGQTLPRILVGYERPRLAADWPFVSLVPLRDRRDLIAGTLEALQVGLVCGVRAADSDTATGIGLRAVDALTDACLALLTTPRAYAVSGRHLFTDTAELTDTALVHPHYELELTIDLRIAGPAR